MLSCVRLFMTPWTAAHQASLSFTVSWSLLKFMSTDLVILSNHFIFFCLLLLLPSVFRASGSFPMSQLSTSGGQNIEVSASVLSVNIRGWFPLGLTGLISLQTLKSLLQYANLKASVLQCSTFLMVQLSHPHMTTGKTIALTIRDKKRAQALDSNRSHFKYQLCHS